MATRPEHLDDFEKEAWCQQLLSAPDVRPMPMDSRHIGGPTGVYENSFFAQTIATPTTLRACMPLRRGADEVLLLLSLGTHLSGHSSLLAGGVVCALLDEALGLAAMTRFARTDADTFFTVELNVKYRRPVRTPGLALCRARVERVEGRRLYATGTIEDGRGGVCAVGHATFVKAKPVVHL